MNDVHARILAGRVKDLRITLELTQAEFAQRLKIPLGELCNYEIALRRPSYIDTGKFYRLAIECGERDLAKYFLDRLKGMEYTEK